MGGLHKHVFTEYEHKSKDKWKINLLDYLNILNQVGELGWCMIKKMEYILK